MPITQSAVKQMRKSRKRHTLLVPYKTRMKTAMKSFKDAVKAGKKDEAVKMLPAVYKAIDMAAKKNLIHDRNADRKKSLVARMLAAK